MSNVRFPADFPSQLKEAVLRHHYNRPEYRFDIEIVTFYNVCPLCGSVDALEEKKVAEGEEGGGIEVTSLVESCKSCQIIAYRHPEMFIWVRNIIAAQEFVRGKESTPTFRSEEAQKKSPEEGVEAGTIAPEEISQASEQIN